MHDYELDEYPVFAKAGAIVPLLEYTANSQSFENLRVKVFKGAENDYTLYDEREIEDAGSENAADLFTPSEKTKESLASLRFELRKSEDDYELTVVPLANCTTKHITIEAVGEQLIDLQIGKDVQTVKLWQ